MSAPTAREGLGDLRGGFCYQQSAATRLIRAHFQGTERAVALGIYQTLTDVANQLGGQAAREHFEASRAQLAREAGVSDRTLDRYVKDFEALGLVAVGRRREGGLNLPNFWGLLEVVGGETASPPLAKQLRQGGETNDTRSKEEQPRRRTGRGADGGISRRRGSSSHIADEKLIGE